MTLRRANLAADAFEDRFWSGVDLDELAHAIGTQPAGAMARVFAAGMTESRQGGTSEAAEKMMGVASGREIEALSRGLVALRVAIVLAPAAAVAAAAGALALGGPPLMAPACVAAAVVVAAGAAVRLLLLQAAIARFAGRLHAFRIEFAVILARQAAPPAMVQKKRM